MRIIIPLSCWLRNPWKSSCNCFYPVWFVAFTGTNKSLVTCIQNTIEGAVSIVALARCNDSLIQQLNEWDGVLWQILDLHIGALQETAHALGQYNGKKRTMIIRFLDLDTFQPHEKKVLLKQSTKKFVYSMPSNQTSKTQKTSSESCL